MQIFNFLKRDIEPDSHRIFFHDLATQTQVRENIEYACQKNIHLTITLDERPTTYKSIFLEVGKLNNFVIIDILIPDHGNQLLKTSTKIRIDYTIEGIMYSFDSRFIEEKSGRFPSIKIAFPTLIKKIQRRKHFRVSPSIDTPILVKLTDGINERAADISEGGVAIYTNLTEKELAIGKVFESVMFKLPHANQNIMTKAVVRNLIIGLGGENKNRCGMEFIDMEMQDKDLIASYVLMCLREMVQRQTD